MTLSKEIFVSVLFLCITSYATAQPQIPDFGDIPDRHWQVNSFEGDSSLGAIVLFDHGNVEMGPDFSLFFKRHVRIKILSEKGYDWATVTIPYLAEDRRQDVDRPNAVAYNRTPDGDVTSSKVRRRDIFEEKISERLEQVKFTFPAVQAGTIIEYEYEVEYEELADFPDWSFQRSIPTLVSFFESSIPDWFNYTFYKHGQETLNYTDEEIISTSKHFSVNQNSARGVQNVRMNVDMVHRDWVIKDVPALEEEPYMSSLNNFVSKLFVQLNSIHYPNGRIQSVLSDWRTVVEELNDHDQFGQQLRESDEVKATVRQLVSDAKNDFQKMQLVYDYVTENLTWNESLSFLAEQSPEEVLEQKSGNSAEINMLLTLMLRHAGIQANPVMLSTRDNGRLLTVFPIMAQFNHVICEARIGSDRYYLDGKSDFRPYNLLPESDLNGNALVVKSNGNHEWVQLNSTSPSEEKYYVTAFMQEDGTLSGSVKARITGYPALDMRVNFEEGDKEEQELLRGELFKSYNDVEIDSFEIGNKEEFDKTLTLETHFSNLDISESSSAQFMYLNPMLFIREQTNPFQKEKRKYPVVFSSPFKQELLVTIYLPPNIKVDEVPQSKRVKLMGGSGVATRIIQKQKQRDQDILMMKYDLQFNRHIFLQDEYKPLKTFWQDLVSTHDELVVLSRGGTDVSQN